MAVGTVQGWGGGLGEGLVAGARFRAIGEELKLRKMENARLEKELVLADDRLTLDESIERRRAASASALDDYYGALAGAARQSTKDAGTKDTALQFDTLSKMLAGGIDPSDGSSSMDEGRLVVEQLAPMLGAAGFPMEDVNKESYAALVYGMESQMLEQNDLEKYKAEKLAEYQASRIDVQQEKTLNPAARAKVDRLGTEIRAIISKMSTIQALPMVSAFSGEALDPKTVKSIRALEKHYEEEVAKKEAEIAEVWRTSTYGGGPGTDDLDDGDTPLVTESSDQPGAAAPTQELGPTGRARWPGAPTIGYPDPDTGAVYIGGHPQERESWDLPEED